MIPGARHYTVTTYPAVVTQPLPSTRQRAKLRLPLPADLFSVVTPLHISVLFTIYGIFFMVMTGLDLGLMFPKSPLPHLCGAFGKARVGYSTPPHRMTLLPLCFCISRRSWEIGYDTTHHTVGLRSVHEHEEIPYYTPWISVWCLTRQVGTLVWFRISLEIGKDYGTCPLRHSLLIVRF